MKTYKLTLLFIIFLTSCGQMNVNKTSINSTIDSSYIKQKGEENNEPNTKELRNEYISKYNNIGILDTTFNDNAGKQIHIQTKYYCLFDNALTIPKQYVWEDTTKTFTTYNYAQNIKITIDHKTIFDKTITKNDFVDKLHHELKKYAVLMFPTFTYLKEKKTFCFGYSVSIPITDVGAGWRLLIDEKGNSSKTDR